jgi:thiol-disulfide isomerase/thioredoxin
MISLHSLRGQYTLLVFWASWCTDCREQTQKLIQIYKQHAGELFRVYQVSLDKSRESWVDALTRDKYPWINVSDLKYWHSAAAETYLVKQVPYYFLIDPDGRITTKTIHHSEIEKKLKTIP